MKKPLLCILAILLIVVLVSCVSEGPTTESSPDDSELILSATDVLKSLDGVLSIDQVHVSTYDDVDLSSIPEDYQEMMKTMIDGIVNKTISYSIIYKVGDVKVQAFCSVPFDYIENPRSLIVYCRGGNGSFGAIEESLTAAYSYYSDCIVLATQYRETSPGTGKDEFGGADVQDVLFWINHAKELTFANTDRVYLLGESRGGMEVCLALRDAPAGIIKAAASVSGIYDLTAVYNAREDMRTMLANRVGGTPNTIPEAYDSRSAVTFANQINVPILIIHSTEDPKVPYAQAQSFADALDSSGKTYEFITREDGVHSMSSPEELKTIIEWLNSQ